MLFAEPGRNDPRAEVLILKKKSDESTAQTNHHFFRPDMNARAIYDHLKEWETKYIFPEPESCHFTDTVSEFLIPITTNTFLLDRHVYNLTLRLKLF